MMKTKIWAEVKGVGLTIVVALTLAVATPVNAGCNAVGTCASTTCNNGTMCQTNSGGTSGQTVGAAVCGKGVQSDTGNCGTTFVRSHGVDCINAGGGCGGVATQPCSS